MSANIQTFVFFDIETTGLPHLERNRTKITELCFIAVPRGDIKSKLFNTQKYETLNFLVNPKKRMSRDTVNITGITYSDLKNELTFGEKFFMIEMFFKSLPEPICIVAHNGNSFDYKILLAECNDIDKYLPDNILCLDSLPCLRTLIKRLDDEELKKVESEVWPELEIGSEELKQIDELCDAFFKDCNDEFTDSNVKVKKKKVKVVKSTNIEKSKLKLNLGSVYKKLTGKDIVNAHRAKVDCLMLIECILSVHIDFLKWADYNCKPLNYIEPLRRR